ncbi:hypothetical protein HHU08_04215 [Bacillus sp. UniB3]|uniref:Uncharacterized protein n=1 Tax=Niallia alba TaxID=2729105 RepID=A0A7Y0PKU2_9BACI|nr:hypothetical protein [Niallia alba]
MIESLQRFSLWRLFKYVMAGKSAKSDEKSAKVVEISAKAGVISAKIAGYQPKQV